MSQTTDPYEALHVLSHASTEVIQAAYRRRARETHPDAGGDPDEFRRVQEAWETLRDPESRAHWDRQRNADRPTSSAQSDDRATHPASPPPQPHQTAPADVLSVPWSGGRGTGLVVRPGAGHLWVRLVVTVLTLVWAVGGVWIGVEGGRSLTVSAIAWAVCWVASASFTAFSVIRGKGTLLMVLLAGLAWPAFTDRAGEPWAWAVYGWLLWMVVGTIIHRRLSKPIASMKRATQGPVFGEASWEGRNTAPLVEKLCAIPAVRVVHLGSVPGAPEHVVVCDRRVAVVGTHQYEASDRGLLHFWPMSITEDPQRALDEMTEFLTRDNDGRTVDRRILGDVGI